MHAKCDCSNCGIYNINIMTINFMKDFEGLNNDLNSPTSVVVDVFRTRIYQHCMETLQRISN